VFGTQDATFPISLSLQWDHVTDLHQYLW
jgi:hypothetical protein